MNDYGSVVIIAAPLSCESLFDDAEAAMMSVCEFIGEPFSEEVPRPTPLPIERPVRLVRSAPGGNSWKTVAKANAKKWDTGMPSSEMALFESVAGDRLGTLGYPVEGLGRRITGTEKLLWEGHDKLLPGGHRLRGPSLPQRPGAFLRFRSAELRGRLFKRSGH